MATRRDFLKNITLASGVLATSSAYADNEAAKKKKMKAGIQLYTLRDVINTDLHGTLSELGKMGYNSVEAYGFDGNFFNLPAKEFRKICNDLGMDIPSTHTGITASNAAEYTEKGAEAGLKYLILPSFMGRPDKTIDDYKAVAREMNQIGEITRKSGIKFGYHNHNHEFKPIDGKLPYDILLAETDPALVAFEMDIYWVVKGGLDPLIYFDKYPGRFELWHVKDMSNDGETCIVGNGHIRFKDMLKHAKKAGLKNMVYEQEHYSEGTPMFCAGQSYKYMQKHLL